VADNDGLFQPQLIALPSDIVREPCYGVFLLWRVARPVTTEIDGHDPTALGEMGDLGREDPVIAGPTIDQNQRGALGGTRSGLKMREAHTFTGYENQP
jgi:hypothetical protein